MFLSSFPSYFFSLVKNPFYFTTKAIQKNISTNFYLFLLLLISACQYLSLVQSFSLSLSIPTLLLMMLSYISVFSISVFLETAITCLFLKKTENTSPFPFKNFQIFILIVSSYFPFLILPSVATLSVYTSSPVIYFLAILICFIWMIYIRTKLFASFKEFFHSNTLLIALSPTIIYFTFSWSSLLFLFSFASFLFFKISF